MSNYPEQVVNKDGKTTTLIKIIENNNCIVGFKDTSIQKQYSLSDYLSGKTSDKLIASGGKLFKDVHRDEIRKMKNGIWAKIIDVVDEDKHIVAVVLADGGGCVYETSYSDFYKGDISNSKAKKLGDSYTLSTEFDKVFEDYINRKDLTFIVPMRNGRYKLFGRTISHLEPTIRASRFTIYFSVEVNGKTVRSCLDKAILSVFSRGCKDEYFDDAIEADKFLTKGFYTKQFWIKAAVAYTKGNLDKKLGINTRRKEFTKALDYVKRGAFIVSERPMDEYSHNLARYASGKYAMYAGKSPRSNRFSDSEIDEAYRKLYEGQTQRKSQPTIREIGEAYRKLYGIQ